MVFRLSYNDKLYEVRIKERECFKHYCTKPTNLPISVESKNVRAHIPQLINEKRVVVYDIYVSFFLLLLCFNFSTHKIQSCMLLFFLFKKLNEKPEMSTTQPGWSCVIN